VYLGILYSLSLQAFILFSLCFSLYILCRLLSLQALILFSALGQHALATPARVQVILLQLIELHFAIPLAGYVEDMLFVRSQFSNALHHIIHCSMVFRLLGHKPKLPITPPLAQLIYA
jgi:hypothetical protein